MLKYSFNEIKASDAIEKAIDKVLEDGYRTADIMQEGMTEVDTQKMGDLICDNIWSLSRELL